MSGANGSFAPGQRACRAADWTIRCATYQGHTPMLDDRRGRDRGLVLPSLARTSAASTVAFAAELAREAGRFAAEVERLYAAQQAATAGRRGRRTGGLIPEEMRRGGWSWNLRPSLDLPTSGMK